MIIQELPILIELEPTWWDKAPDIQIKFDNEVLFETIVSSTRIFEFVAKVDEEENQLHLIEIILQNKTDSQTIVENGEIVKDQLIHVKNITMDEYEIDNLKWILGQYHFNKPQMIGDTMTDNLPGCTTLGINGVYSLEFTTPYYYWLLENIE